MIGWLLPRLYWMIRLENKNAMDTFTKEKIRSLDWLGIHRDHCEIIDPRMLILVHISC